MAAVSTDYGGVTINVDTYDNGSVANGHRRSRYGVANDVEKVGQTAFKGKSASGSLGVGS